MVVDDKRKFEHDPNKNTLNLGQGRIDVETAKRAFDDPGRIMFQARTKGSEERGGLLGMIDGRLWLVIYTMRGDVTRIITWRPARDEERDLYARSKI